jgi:hypothetical protein
LASSSGRTNQLPAWLISTARRCFCKYTQAYMGAHHSTYILGEDPTRKSIGLQCSAYTPTTLEHPRRIHGPAHARDGSTPKGSERPTTRTRQLLVIFSTARCVFRCRSTIFSNPRTIGVVQSDKAKSRWRLSAGLE